MRALLASIVVLVSSTAAFASGGLSCEVDDEVLKLSVESGVTRGMGGPLFNFRGTAELLDPKTPTYLRTVTFGDENVPQYWSDATTLDLLLYRETEGDLPHAYVEITIQTQPRDSEEGTFGGQYSLTMFDGGKDAAEPTIVEHSGGISCFVE